MVKDTNKDITEEEIEDKQLLKDVHTNNEVKDFFDKFMSNNPTKNNDEEERETNKSIYYDRLIKEFYDISNMELKSDITDKQVLVLSKATMFAGIFKSQVMYELIQYILKYGVSKSRKGRTEFQEIFKFANEMQTETGGNRWGQFRGLMGNTLE